MWTYRSIRKLPNIWRKKVNNHYQFTIVALKVSHSHLLKESAARRAVSWVPTLQDLSWLSTEGQTLSGQSLASDKHHGDPRAYHLWSFWLPSSGQSLHWNFLVAGWDFHRAALQSEGLPVNPASFPSFYKGETSITVRSLYITIFCLLSLFSSQELPLITLAFLFSFSHLFPRDPVLSLGCHYWP